MIPTMKYVDQYRAWLYVVDAMKAQPPDMARVAQENHFLP
jgi:hypothetical protein